MIIGDVNGNMNQSVKIMGSVLFFPSQLKHYFIGQSVTHSGHTTRTKFTVQVKPKRIVAVTEKKIDGKFSSHRGACEGWRTAALTPRSVIITLTSVAGQEAAPDLHEFTPPTGSMKKCSCCAGTRCSISLPSIPHILANACWVCQLSRPWSDSSSEGVATLSSGAAAPTFAGCGLIRPEMELTSSQCHPSTR